MLRANIRNLSLIWNRCNILFLLVFTEPGVHLLGHPCSAARTYHRFGGQLLKPLVKILRQSTIYVIDMQIFLHIAHLIIRNDVRVVCTTVTA